MDEPPPEAPWIAERRRIGTGFARFYAAFAVAVVVVSALPLYDDVQQQRGESTFTRRFGSVWEMLAIDRGGVAGLGAALLVMLVLLLVLAGLRPPLRPGVPLAIALLGAGLGLLVLLRVGIRPPQPPLADGGQATLALTLLLVLMATAHTVRLFFGAVPQPSVTPPRADPADGAGTPPR